MVQDTWPLCSTQNAFSFRDLENATVSELWSKKKSQLFCDDEEDMLVEKGMISSEGIFTAFFETEQALEHHLESEKNEKSNELPADHSSFYFINPDYGWDVISITEKSMRMILHSIKVFTPFFKYIRAFGIKSFSKDEGYGGFDLNISKDPSSNTNCFELCYLLKYVDKKEKPGKASNPWSIRQALVYQKSSLERGCNEYIFVRLSEFLGDMFKSLLSKSRAQTSLTASPHWTEVQALCFRSVIANWRSYINWIDQEVSLIFDRVILAEIQAERIKGVDTAATSLKDTKRLQYLLDQALRASHMLDLNIDVMAQLSGAALHVRHLNILDQDTPCDNLIQELKDCTKDHSFLKKNVLSLISRTTILSNQLRDTVSFRNSEISKEVGILTSRGTAAMVNISNKTSHEAQVVKVLTVVALIFIPTSFAAEFMQMGYISVADTGGFNVSATKGLLFYAILAIPLVSLTVAIYFLSELVNKRASRRDHAWDV